MRIGHDIRPGSVIFGLKDVAAIRFIETSRQQEGLFHGGIEIFLFQQGADTLQERLFRGEFVLYVFLFKDAFRNVGGDLHVERFAFVADEFVLDAEVTPNFFVIMLPDIGFFVGKLVHGAEGAGRIEILKELVAFLACYVGIGKEAAADLIEPEDFVCFGIVDVDDVIQ